MCQVSAWPDARYWVNLPTAEETLDQWYDADVTPKVPTVLTNTSAPRSNWQPKKVAIPWVYRDLAVCLLYIRCERERVEAS